MRVIPSEVINVKCHLRMINKTLKELMKKVYIKITDRLAIKLNVVFESRAT